MVVNMSCEWVAVVLVQLCDVLHLRQKAKGLPRVSEFDLHSFFLNKGQGVECLNFTIRIHISEGPPGL